MFLFWRDWLCVLVQESVVEKWVLCLELQVVRFERAPSSWRSSFHSPWDSSCSCTLSLLLQHTQPPTCLFLSSELQSLWRSTSKLWQTWEELLNNRKVIRQAINQPSTLVAKEKTVWNLHPFFEMQSSSAALFPLAVLILYNYFNST